jgi:hypothetical protein
MKTTTTPIKKNKITAYCFRNGVIKFRAGKEPKGALNLARGTGKRFRDVVTANARLAYDGKTWLVPGIPEAMEDDNAACDAAIRFSERIRFCMKPKGKE